MRASGKNEYVLSKLRYISEYFLKDNHFQSSVKKDPINPVSNYLTIGRKAKTILFILFAEEFLVNTKLHLRFPKK